MERRLTEEQVTKSIIKWLLKNNWTIIAFDYPQSGTGRCLHPNDSKSKTGGIWIPDIIAHKEDTLIFFENKDKYVYSDFEKINKLKNTNIYSNAIREITLGYNYEKVFYGIGFTKNQNDTNKTIDNLNMIDFLITVIDKDNINIEYNPHNIW